MTPETGHWCLRNKPLQRSHPTRRRAPLNDRTLRAVTSGSGWRQEYSPEWFPIPLKSSFIPTPNLVLVPPRLPLVSSQFPRYASPDKYFHRFIDQSLLMHAKNTTSSGMFPPK